MSRRRGFILAFGLLAGFLAIAGLLYKLGRESSSPKPHPPELGGQKVPDTIFEIRFDVPYDLFCSFYSEERTIYRNCKILGFTGRGEESARSGRSSGSSGFSGLSGSGSGYYSQQYFDHWLVLKLEDGRLAYIPPGAVKYIEEASPRSQ
jgi:hypothetical protein